jgi:hypothetical protein
MHTDPEHRPTSTRINAHGTTHSIAGLTHPQTVSSQPNRRRLAPIIALLAALALPTGTTQAIAQTPSTPASEETSSLPQLSDFTPPYTCPWFFGRPSSCDIPIKVAVECIDRRSLHPSAVSRPLTKTETFNEKKACELLPLWLDKDPRIETVEHGKEDLALKYRISPFGRKFSGVQIFVRKESFVVTKEFQDPFDNAAYFIEKSLLDLEKRGYLP